jgi:hypothetical protein
MWLKINNNKNNYNQNNYQLNYITEYTSRKLYALRKACTVWEETFFRL